MAMVNNYSFFARSDTERLQSLTEKQAKTIEENVLYIKELEDRERVLAQNVIICFSKKLRILHVHILGIFFFDC